MHIQTPQHKPPCSPSKMPGVLVMEDDQAIADLLSEVFKMAGYNFLIESQSDDILKLVGEYKPDLIILDYLLPGVNGGEMCSLIKKNRNTSAIPVIIYSAYPRVMLSLGTYGCYAFIPKPFDLDELSLCIDRLLGIDTPVKPRNTSCDFSLSNL